MAMLRSRRLEGLFGAELNAVTATHIKGLVDGGVVEAYDLDFKGELYGHSDSEKRDLAGDVAALANTAGGVIVLGVEQDQHARATLAPGVAVSDAEVARIRQVVAGNVAPLPTFDVISVLDEPTDGNGFILIAVPRSVLAPHAVLINQALRFPVRNGSTTHYLSEPEVAAAYRARLLNAAQLGNRLERVEGDVIGRADRTDAPWIVMSLQPEVPGDLAISHATFAEFETTVRALPTAALDGLGLSFRQFDVGHERLHADDSMQRSAAPWGLATDLYVDGAGVLGQRLYDIREGVSPRDPQLDTLSDEGVAAAIIWGFQFLGLHARDRAHASGTAALRVSVAPALDAERVAMGNSRHDYSVTISARELVVVPPVATYALIDELAEGGEGLIAAAARLHHAIGNAFGVPELPQLTRDGQFNWRSWSSNRRPAVQAWASAHGVRIDGLP